MTKSNRVTETYKSGEYFIDIVECTTRSGSHGVYESWIYHREYGIKMQMFGALKAEHSKEDFIAIVEKNLPHYKSFYKHEYEG